MEKSIDTEKTRQSTVYVAAKGQLCMLGLSIPVTEEQIENTGNGNEGGEGPGSLWVKEEGLDTLIEPKLIRPCDDSASTVGKMA